LRRIRLCPNHEDADTVSIAIAPIDTGVARTGLWARRKWEILRVASPVALVVLWQLGSAIGVISQDVLPAPSLIAEAGVELLGNGQLVDALKVSGLRVIEGLLLGGPAGIALGAAVGLSRWFEATIDPPMQMLRALPHLGLIPLFILWFGIGELPKVLLVALGWLSRFTSTALRRSARSTPSCSKPLRCLAFRSGSGSAGSSFPAQRPLVLVGLRKRRPSRG